MLILATCQGMPTGIEQHDSDETPAKTVFFSRDIMDIIFKKLPLKSKAALTSTNIQYKEAYLHEIPRAFADNFGIKTIDKLSIDIFC
jgi:hypothetical protein